MLGKIFHNVVYAVSDICLRQHAVHAEQCKDGHYYSHGSDGVSSLLIIAVISVSIS